MFKDPKSRSEALIQNILGADNVLEPAQSREEEILYAILNNTSYTKEPQSRKEELLLCILNGTTTTLVPRSRNEQILVAKINGQEYTKDPKSRMEELLIQWLVTYEDVTVSGSTVSFSDGAAGQKLVHCVADIDAVQDLNGYSNPWPAGGGANQWDEEWELGVYASADGQPYPTTTNIRSKSTNYISVVPNETYYFNTSGKVMEVYQYDADKGYISKTNVTNQTVTFTGNVRYIRFDMAGAYGTTYNHDIAINYPASVTTYSPYSNICPITGWSQVKVNHNGTDITTNLSGTIYGGTVDVVTGEETVTHGIEILNGTGNYSKYAVEENGSFYYLPSWYDGTTKVVTNSQISDYLPKSLSPQMTSPGICLYSAGYFYINLFGEVSTLDACKAYLAEHPLTVVYQLATPTAATVTATEITQLSGTNTLYADSGDISVTYKRVQA